MAREVKVYSIALDRSLEELYLNNLPGFDFIMYQTQNKDWVGFEPNQETMKLDYKIIKAKREEISSFLKESINALTEKHPQSHLTLIHYHNSAETIEISLICSIKAIPGANPL